MNREEGRGESFKCDTPFPYLSSSHAVEEILLRSNACEESPVHETPGTRTGVIGQEGGEETPTGHHRWALSLQLNLSEQGRNLHAVHLKHT